MLTNNRRTYLETIGLSLDPFATPVAEQELSLSTYLPAEQDHYQLRVGLERPSFFSFFSPTPIPSKKKTVIQALRQPSAAFLYGKPGAGKTTLRFILESESRCVPDRTLIVSNIFTEDIRRPLTPEEHWERLAKALAIDLFVQVVEQFNPLNSFPTYDQIHALRQQIRVGGHPLTRLVQRILDEPEPNALMGLGMLWPAVRRPVVRYVARSQPLLNLIGEVVSSDDLPFRKISGEDALFAGFQAAKVWGFERIFVLVDGVDTRQRTLPDMMALIEPLLDKLETWQDYNVAAKFFLPLELKPSVSRRKSKLKLHFKPFEAKIEWDEVSLRALLRERFRAARSRRLGFDDLAGFGLKGKLDKLIFCSAQGSPRRLLRTVSELINAHAIRNPHDPLITLSDWQDMRARWMGDPPPAASST